MSERISRRIRTTAEVAALPFRPDYRDFLRRRRPAPRRDNGRVILLNAYNWFRYPALYINSIIAPVLAEEFDADIETFDVTPKRHPESWRLYEGFGARLGLRREQVTEHADWAKAEARRLIAAVGSIGDFIALRWEGIQIGDLAYDMRLRYGVRASADLADPMLAEYLAEALQIWRAASRWLESRSVVALLPDHTLFVRSGVMTRLALQNGIPVYLAPFTPEFTLQRLDPHVAMGMENPAKRWRYWEYRETFGRLSQSVRDTARERARDWLERGLGGEVRDNVLRGQSAYSRPTGQRLLADTTTPKILILLHDYCDNVHCFRKMLFDDFLAWSRHLFARASATPWEWYAKPHPNSLTSDEKNALNEATLRALCEEFPKIRALPASASNRQLVDEGIAAAFTVHGTAGYELAYLGVPVVNAGDNLQIDFSFNLNPGTIGAFDQLIADAGRLDHRIDRSEVEAMVAMHHFVIPEATRCEVNPIPESWRTDPQLWVRNSKELMQAANEPGSLSHLMRAETADVVSRVQAYARSVARR